MENAANHSWKSYGTRLVSADIICNYINNICFFAGIVLTFYLAFYAGLATLVAICVAGLFLTLDDKRPTYILQESLIGRV